MHSISLCNLPLITACHILLDMQLMDLCAATGQAFTLNPCMQFEMSMYRVDLHASGPPPERGHWKKVVEELHMEQEQLDVVAICWEMDVKAMVGSGAAELLCTMRHKLSNLQIHISVPKHRTHD
jgi:hypothetical protein